MEKHQKIAAPRAIPPYPPALAAHSAAFAGGFKAIWLAGRGKTC
ncbi:MAG: hypothetical protein RBS08_10015 [Bdellovibrionales bacterium]|jgi:hypothetical protein|nr:hypothetical protein [Bdellovibrionales bacterium]